MSKGDEFIEAFVTLAVPSNLIQISSGTEVRPIACHDDRPDPWRLLCSFYSIKQALQQFLADAIEFIRSIERKLYYVSVCAERNG
jgi:hypothetical protein